MQGTFATKICQFFPVVTLSEYIAYISIENTFLSKIVIVPWKVILDESLRKHSVNIRVG